ncbi:hypothetical protein VNI00_000617 [Paramarasmius palmivorus]|uniref:ABC1 atypical kinase-like domain-containing protein n=1 Tax=Paramarasmius palmivorus TaxID=297713 RepID=A0AAW0E9T1_9AGAR
MGCCMLVKPTSHFGAFNLPETLVLKLGDRRFGCRTPWDDGKPWSPESESILRDKVTHVMSLPREQRDKVLGKDVYDAWNSDSEWDWEWDLWSWHFKTEAIQKEIAAYRHLHSLQGTIIPRFYGAVTCRITPPSLPYVHEVLDMAQGLLLEHVEGPSMAELEVGKNISAEQANDISSRAIDTIRHIRDADWMHCDPRPANIILREPVIIDFGLSHGRRPNLTDEEWFYQRDDVTHLRSTLINHWYRDRVCTPLDAAAFLAKADGIEDPAEREEARRRTIRFLNDMAEDHKHRHLVYERIPNSGGDGEKDSVLQWRVKPGVTRTRKHLRD